MIPPEIEFKKMSFLGLRLAELSGREDETRGEEMTALLNAFLSQVKEHLRQPENERPHFLHEVLQYLHSHFQERITLDDLAGRFGLNRSHFSTTFNEKVGMRIDAYLKILRITRSQALLKETHLPVSQVAVEVGFENSSHFTKAFREKTGLSPSEYRKPAAAKKK
ncbi:MAG: helix-turn-helix transcriptional regulator [Spirochaetia bacterium]|nr:helix-turn-helix transcriptional regulator [Spirochaetia bacterium]